MLKRIYFEIKYFLQRLRPKKPIILMYHRVAKDVNDPHLLCVSPENFREHLRYLSQNKNIVRLSEILNRNIPKNTVAITFDDGYADNLYAALPILKEFKAPATIFITAGLLGQKFPWDDRASEGRAMTEEELRLLGRESLIEIGSHTLSHPRLPKLNAEEKKREIMESKNMLEKITGKTITSFAYPFGEYDHESLEIVSKIYARAAAVKAEPVVNANIFELPRYIVRNWDKKKFQRKINIFR